MPNYQENAYIVWHVLHENLTLTYFVIPIYVHVISLFSIRLSTTLAMRGSSGLTSCLLPYFKINALFTSISETDIGVRVCVCERESGLPSS